MSLPEPLPEPWGYPNPLYNYKTGTYDNGGVIWHGDSPPTKQDFEALVAVTGPNVNIDVASCFGLPNFNERNAGKGDYTTTVVLG